MKLVLYIGCIKQAFLPSLNMILFLCIVHSFNISVLSEIIFFNLSFNTSGNRDSSHIESHLGAILTRLSMSFSAVWRAIPQVSANLRKSPLCIFDKFIAYKLIDGNVGVGGVRLILPHYMVMFI